MIITGPVICSIDNKFYLKALYKGNNVLLDSVDVVSDTNIIEKFKNMDSTKLRSYIDLATLTDNSIMSVDTLGTKKEL